MANYFVTNCLLACFVVAFALPLVNCENVTNNIDRNEMGMGVLYDMVSVFLVDVVHTDPVLDSFLNLSKLFVDGELQEDQVPDDWQEWADHLIGFAVCVGFGILFIIVMPIVGLIFCCCRCCGNCGAKGRKHDSKRATCKRRSYCTVLLILNTVVLAGVVCAFVCNSLIYKHLQNEDNQGTIGHVKTSLASVEQYVNHTVNEASVYVTMEFDSVSQQILQDVNDTSVAAVDEVLEQLRAPELLKKAYDISREANKTADELVKVGILLSDLSNKSNELKDNLTSIKNDISDVCNSPGSSCSGFDPNDYDTDADFSSLDKLSLEASKVADALDLNAYVIEAEETLEKAKADAKGQVQQQTEEASKTIDDVRKSIEDGISNLKQQKDDALSGFPGIQSDLNEADDETKKYSEYVYYGLIGVCCAYLLIVVLYYIGILYGLCGERPGHDAPCCNTGCGANFLIAGVAFTFIFSWLLMLLCVVMFAVGGPVYAEVCSDFEDHDPQQLKVFDQALINGLNIKDLYDNPSPDLSVVNMLSDCKRNRPIFSALRLDGIVDLDEIMNIQDLKSKLDDLKTATINVPDINILTPEFEKELTDFADSGLESVNFTKYFAELSKGLTVADLGTLANGVREIAKNEADMSNKEKLERSASRLDELNENDLPDITKKVMELNRTMITLQQQSTLRDSVLSLIDDLEKAQRDFNVNKTELIRSKIEKLADDIYNIATDKVDSVKYEIREEKFGCQDLSNAFYTMSDSACVLIVNPVNGLWFSFGWCLFFLIPCLIFAVLLAGQYRIEHEYDKEFDDPNYMMYGGPNPDTIPLTRLEQAPRGSHSQHQAQPNGMYNPGYREDSKRPNSYAAPPPYEDHMHPGIAAYAPPRQEYNLARSYPALHGDGQMAGSGSRNSYAYPY